MKEAETAREIDAAAAAWAVRAETSGDEPDFISKLEAWLTGDPRRRGALLRAQAVLSLVAPEPAVHPGPAATETSRSFAPTRRHFLAAGGVVAAAAVVAVVSFELTDRAHYETELGEVRRLPLPDGSVATINTASRLDIALKPELRQIDLLTGEAWFRVAKDPERPFIVAAGPVRVRAVGTAFSVRRREAGADVLVTEGVVEAWSVEGGAGKRIRISAGGRGFVPDRTEPILVAAKSGEVDRALAWRNGEISLYGETLSYAVSEFNRYNSRKIVISDSNLAAEKLVGQFRTDEPEAFSKAVAATLNAGIVEDGATIRLTRTAAR